MSVSDADSGERKLKTPSIKRLLSMRADGREKITLPSGGVVAIRIDKPSWLDKRWAKKMDMLPWQARQEELSIALSKGKIWRVAYLLAQDEEYKKQNKTNKLLNLDGLINWGDSTGYWGVLAKAIASDQPASAVLLLASGADVERIPPTEPNKRPMRMALAQNDKDMVGFLCDAGAEIYQEDLPYAVSSSMKEKIKLELAKAKVKTKEKPKVKLESPKKAKDFTKRQAVRPLKYVSKTNSLWEKMDDYTISKTVQSTTARIQTIFNFQASRMTHIHETLSGKDERVIHRHSPVIEYFNAVQNAKEIEEAYDRLSDMGGKPDYKSRNKDYKSARVIHRKKSP